MRRLWGENMALITIGGVPVTGITKYTVRRSDLDSENTTRNEAGYMQRDRVRMGAYSVDVACQVKKAAYKSIVDALTPAKFTAVFFDPNSATTQTATMYAGDRSGDLIQLLDETVPGESLWELSFTLVEY